MASRGIVILVDDVTYLCVIYQSSIDPEYTSTTNSSRVVVSLDGWSLFIFIFCGSAIVIIIIIHDIT